MTYGGLTLLLGQRCWLAGAVEEVRRSWFVNGAVGQRLCPR